MKRRHSRRHQRNRGAPSAAITVGMVWIEVQGRSTHRWNGLSLTKTDMPPNGITCIGIKYFRCSIGSCQHSFLAIAYEACSLSSVFYGTYSCTSSPEFFFAMSCRRPPSYKDDVHHAATGPPHTIKLARRVL